MPPMSYQPTTSPQGGPPVQGGLLCSFPNCPEPMERYITLHFTSNDGGPERVGPPMAVCAGHLYLASEVVILGKPLREQGVLADG